MIVEQIKRMMKPRTVIPLLNSKAGHKLKGWGKRRGKNALIYLITNHKNPSKPSEKGITESEWEQAYQQITSNGYFSRKWFNRNMQACAKEGSCNFIAIGGIFELLDIAVYSRGNYLKKEQ